MLAFAPGARAEEAAAAQDEGPTIEVGGKIFARAAADQRSEYARELSVPLARMQVDVSYGLAEAVMEADITSKALVKDAYIRLHEPTRTARLYVGQFKAPFLQRQLEGRWNLPLISRGLVADYLVGRNALGGRRLGLMGEVEVDAWRDLTIEAGVFEGARDELGQRIGEDASARVAIEPWKFLQLAASTYVGDAFGQRARRAFGADATLSAFGARLTLEAVAGSLAVGRFNGQLAMVTYLLPLGGETWGVEPLVGVETLQLTGAREGRGQAATVGVNVHYAERVRLQVQGERGLFPGDQSMQNRLLVQLGARF